MSKRLRLIDLLAMLAVISAFVFFAVLWFSVGRWQKERYAVPQPTPHINHVTIRIDGEVWECVWDDDVPGDWRCEEQDAETLDK